ncbi:hypothetical protein RFI_24090, partial [Reticulomyxa filosa]
RRRKRELFDTGKKGKKNNISSFATQSMRNSPLPETKPITTRLDELESHPMNTSASSKMKSKHKPLHKVTSNTSLQNVTTATAERRRSGSVKDNHKRTRSCGELESFRQKLSTSASDLRSDRKNYKEKEDNKDDDEDEDEDDNDNNDNDNDNDEDDNGSEKATTKSDDGKEGNIEAMKKQKSAPMAIPTTITIDRKNLQKKKKRIQLRKDKHPLDLHTLHPSNRGRELQRRHSLSRSADSSPKTRPLSATLPSPLALRQERILMQQIQKQAQQQQSPVTSDHMKAEETKESLADTIKHERGRFAFLTDTNEDDGVVMRTHSTPHTASNRSEDDKGVSPACNISYSATKEALGRGLEEDIGYPIDIVEMLLSALERVDRLSVFTIRVIGELLVEIVQDRTMPNNGLLTKHFKQLERVWEATKKNLRELLPFQSNRLELFFINCMEDEWNGVKNRYKFLLFYF